MLRKYLLAGLGFVAAAGFAAAAEAKTVKGKVVWGPLPFCFSVGGYDVSAASPLPEPGSCVRATGTVAKGTMSLCMTGPILNPVKVTPAKGCK